MRNTAISSLIKKIVVTLIFLVLLVLIWQGLYFLTQNLIINSDFRSFLSGMVAGSATYIVAISYLHD